MTDGVLQVTALTGGYGERTIITDVDISVAPSEIVLLVGANGSGKSTILRGIMGLLPACTGEVFLEGRRLTAPTHALRALGIAYMPQRQPVFGTLSVMRNLELAGNLLSARDRKPRIQHMIEEMPALSNRLDQLANTLSGGERQWLGLACALIARPKAILLDEPTAGVSPILRGQLFKEIRGIARKSGVAVLMVEHNVLDARKYVDHVVGLRLGKVAVSCAADEFGEAIQRRVFVE